MGVPRFLPVKREPGGQLFNQDNPKAFISELPDVMTQQFSDIDEVDPDGVFIVGPGLGVGPRSEAVIRFLLQENVEQVVLDADAITSLASMKNIKLPKTWVLTPHSGEMSRLLGISSDEVDGDRIAASKLCSEIYGATVLLKGYKSIVCQGKRIEIINSGNSALATAGTGDVLSGMIGGFMAQGLNTLDATAVAAFLHGTTADLWVKKGKSKNSLMASDLLDNLPESFNWVQNYEKE